MQQIAGGRTWPCKTWGLFLRRIHPFSTSWALQADAPSSVSWISSSSPLTSKEKKFLRGEKREKSISLGKHSHSLYKWIPGTHLAAVWVYLISHFPCVDAQQINATSTHPWASSHLPHITAQQVLSHLPRGQFFQCSVCVGSLHGLPLA